MRTRYPEIILCLVLLVSAVAACKGSSSSGNAGGTVFQGVAIGPGGGTAVIMEQAGDVSGARVYIPGNALESEQIISLRSVPLPSALPTGYRAAGPCIGFSPDGTAFSQPVSLYLPYL